MADKKERPVCARCGARPVWTRALRHGHAHCVICSIYTACSNCGAGGAAPRLIWHGHTFCGSCRQLGHADAGAIGTSRESLEDIADRLLRFRAEAGGAAAETQEAKFDTIREAREWGESYGTAVDWCNIYRGERLVASYRRDTGGPGVKWFKAEGFKNEK